MTNKVEPTEVDMNIAQNVFDNLSLGHEKSAVEDIAQAIAQARREGAEAERFACIDDCWEQSNCGDAVKAIRKRGNYND